MYKSIKFNLFVLLFSGIFLSLNIQAAPKPADANAKAAMAKLQAMVKEATTARDTLKTEKDKIASELDQVKKDKESADSETDRLNSELASQKSNNASVSEKLDQTHAKLVEVIEKYNALNKAKNELTVQHTSLESTLKQTESNLQSCESKNVKLYTAGKEVLNSYENKNVLDSVLKDEPIFGFKSVEMESIVQEYEDKLRKEKYQHKDVVLDKTATSTDK